MHETKQTLADKQYSKNRFTELMSYVSFYINCAGTAANSTGMVKELTSFRKEKEEAYKTSF